MQHDIFISYRRDGGEHLAGRVREALKTRGFSIFMDVEDLKSGKFNSALFRKIEEATDIIVILTPGCLDRCNNEDDWLRQEIRHAIKCGKNVVPIIARGFQMSAAQELPPDIAELLEFNGVTPAHELFEASIDRLVSTFLKSKSALDARSAPQNLDVVVACKMEVDVAWERIKDLDRSEGFGALLAQAQQELRLASEYDRRQAYSQAIEGYKKFMLTFDQIQKREQLRQDTQVARRTAQEAMERANSKFTHPHGPVFFAQGKQALTDAEALYSKADFEGAMRLLLIATESFTASVAPRPETNEERFEKMFAARADVIAEVEVEAAQTSKELAREIARQMLRLEINIRKPHLRKYDGAFDVRTERIVASLERLESDVKEACTCVSVVRNPIKTRSNWEHRLEAYCAKTGGTDAAKESLVRIGIPAIPLVCSRFREIGDEGHLSRDSGVYKDSRSVQFELADVMGRIKDFRCLPFLAGAPQSLIASARFVEAVLAFGIPRATVDRCYKRLAGKTASELTAKAGKRQRH